MYSVRGAKRGIELFFSQKGLSIDDQYINLILQYKIDLVSASFVADKSILAIPTCHRTNRQTVLPYLPILDLEENIFSYLLQSITGRQFKYEFIEELLLRLDIVFSLLHIQHLFSTNSILLYKVIDDQLIVKELINVYELKYKLEKDRIC